MYNAVKSTILTLAPAPTGRKQKKPTETVELKTKGFAGMAGKVIVNAIAEAKQPLDKMIIHMGCKRSDKMKQLMGLDYDHVQTSEPNLDQLKLSFVSDKMRSTFKLGNIADILPKASGYNREQPLVIFMHGFTDDPSLFTFPAVNEAFHSKGHHNILALDASPLIRFLYLRASTYVRFIGEKLGTTLAAISESGLDHKNIYLVGHSLGAHIAGFAGKTYHSLTGKLVGRISGLDPAGPCFTHVDSTLRLAKTDAEFVDVIHTNAGVYGITSPVGHVDFFPNGGEHQPNCFFEFQSHNRVVELFAESVKNPEAFKARACKNWEEFKRDDSTDDVSHMGYGCKPETRGVYFLRTGDEKPYGLGKEGLLYDGDNMMKTIWLIQKTLFSLLE